LVVISIIGLLSSIVLASLKSAREKARIAAGQKFDIQMYRTYGASAVAIWNLDEGSGSVVNDTSGNGFHGTLSGGVTWTPQGQNSKSSLVFSGSNQVTFPNRLADSFSLIGTDGSAKALVTAWIKPVSTTNATGFVGGLPGILYVGTTNQGKVRSLGGGASCVSVKSVPAGVWSHIGVMFEEGKNGCVMYIDGQIVEVTGDGGGSMSLVDFPVNSNYDTTSIGNFFDNNNNYFFTGEVDSVRVYYPVIQ